MYLNYILIDLIYSICYKPLLRIGLFLYVGGELHIKGDIHVIIFKKN